VLVGAEEQPGGTLAGHRILPVDPVVTTPEESESAILARQCGGGGG